MAKYNVDVEIRSGMDDRKSPVWSGRFEIDAHDRVQAKRLACLRLLDRPEYDEKIDPSAHVVNVERVWTDR